MKRMEWGEKGNSAFIWDRHKAWGWEGRRRGSVSQRMKRHKHKIPLVPLSLACPFAKLLNLGASTSWAHDCPSVGDRDGGTLSFLSFPQESQQAPNA